MANRHTKHIVGRVACVRRGWHTSLRCILPLAASPPLQDQLALLTHLPYVIFLPLGAVSLNAPGYLAARTGSAFWTVKAGTFTDIISFGLSISLAEGYSVSFAAGVGPIASFRGSDMVHEWQAYELLAANIDGRRIDQSSLVSRSTWGRIKVEHQQNP